MNIQTALKMFCTRLNSTTVQWAKNGAYNFHGLIIFLQHTGQDRTGQTDTSNLFLSYHLR
jgi:hypothetical protein